MSLHAASYFAGVGTVVATIALGFGGGVLLTDAFTGKSERTPTLMERRAAPLSESTAPPVAAAPAPQASEQQTAATAAPVAPAPQPQAPPQTVEPAAAGCRSSRCACAALNADGHTATRLRGGSAAGPAAGSSEFRPGDRRASPLRTEHGTRAGCRSHKPRCRGEEGSRRAPQAGAPQMGRAAQTRYAEDRRTDRDQRKGEGSRPRT